MAPPAPRPTEVLHVLCYKHHTEMEMQQSAAQKCETGVYLCGVSGCVVGFDAERGYFLTKEEPRSAMGPCTLPHLCCPSDGKALYLLEVLMAHPLFLAWRCPWCHRTRLSEETDEEASGAVEPPRTPSPGREAIMTGVRKEKRVPEHLPLLLSPIEEPLLRKSASTENVSAHGLRVRSKQLWKSDINLIVHSSNSRLWVPARVVYCETLGKTFAIGLELLALTGDKYLYDTAIADGALGCQRPNQSAL